MSGPKTRVETSEVEAAEWHARLGAPSVSTETVEAFFAWQSVPANADAYRRVEQVWGESARLAASPQIEAAVDQALARAAKAERPRRLPRTTVGLAAMGLGMVAALAVWVGMQDRSLYSTTIGEQELVQLSDGSSVRLDTASRVRVRFNDEQRLVELETGQALFTVAHDAGRPFIVRAGGAQVTAIGTVFEVRRLAAGVNVTLVSGRVDVMPNEGPVRRLSPGYQAAISPAGTLTRAVDLEATTSWTEGRIVFQDTPLWMAVDEVNRYLEDKIRLSPGPVESQPVNGVFRTGDSEGFIAAASDVFELEVTPNADGSVWLTPKAK
jgi:transmembrane sensor